VLDRRSFLAATAAAAVPARPDPFGGLRVGVQTYTFRKFDFENALKRTKDLGLGYAEFYRGHLKTDSTPEQVKAARKLMDEYGVNPIAFGVERFTKDHSANKKLFDFAAALGAKFLSADPEPDSFDSLDRLVEEYKIAIAIHPHGPSGGNKKHRWYSAETILAAVKDHHPRVGTCLDTGHLIRMGQKPFNQPLDPVQQIRLMGPRNFGLHLKDHDNVRKTDVVFGDKAGVLDVPAVLLALRELTFDGYVAIEYEANPDDPTADVKKCVSYLKEAVAGLG
jgi:sugar phosphate isomerase/epimerase